MCRAQRPCGLTRNAADSLLAGTWPTTYIFREIGSQTMVNDLIQRITIEPGKCGGRPCIRGMRIRVTDILELLAADASYEEILEDYPRLERDDIRAAVQYAARQTDHPVLLAS
jgi:uncharacterized protein (DUF433 family)